MTLGERIKQLYDFRGLTQKEFSAKIGIPQSTIATWNSGRNRLGPTNLKKVCDFFSITPNDLFGYGSTSKKDPLPVKKIPVISWVHANKFEEISPIEISGEYIYSAIKGDKIFALRVQNDCMEPEFKQGDILIINPNIQTDHDSYVVVADHEANTATFKQLKIYGNKKVLHPLNPKYKDIVLDHKKRYYIVGKVIASERVHT